MKKLFILGVVLLGFGCQPSPADSNVIKPIPNMYLEVYGPDKDGVKCIILSSNAISCVYVGVEEK